jgi:hypothetical protein
MEFIGTEKFGLEIFGHMPTAIAKDKVGGNISVDDNSGRVPVSLTVLQLQGIKHPKVPIKFDYVEVLWKIAVILKKRPTWLIVATDIDQPVARSLVGLLMGYPTRGSNIDINDSQRVADVAIRTGEVSLNIHAELNTGSPTQAEKRLLAVRDGARFFKVPWGGAQARTRQTAFVTLGDSGLASETLADGVQWEESATVWHTREHSCGSPEAMALV